jgi:hypothetical protein
MTWVLLGHNDVQPHTCADPRRRSSACSSTSSSGTAKSHSRDAMINNLRLKSVGDPLERFVSPGWTLTWAGRGVRGSLVEGVSPFELGAAELVRQLMPAVCCGPLPSRSRLLCRSSGVGGCHSMVDLGLTSLTIRGNG